MSHGRETAYGLPGAIARKVPIRVPVRVEWQDDGTVVLVYRKNFNRLERWLSRHFGGIKDIRRPLDDRGTAVWMMCDGRHTVAEICRAMHRKYGEGMEPVGPRIWGFVRMLEDRNIVLVLGKKVPRKKVPRKKEEVVGTEAAIIANGDRRQIGDTGSNRGTHGEAQDEEQGK